jgi:hypothetical protein
MAKIGDIRRITDEDIERLRYFQSMVSDGSEDEERWFMKIGQTVPNVFLRRFMGERHFDGVHFFFGLGFIILWWLLSQSMNDSQTAVNGKWVYEQHADMWSFSLIFAYCGMSWFRRRERKQLLSDHNFVMHTRFRGLPYAFWDKIPYLGWVAPHVKEAAALVLLGYVLSLTTQYTHIHWLCWFFAVAKIFNEGSWVDTKQNLMDEADARLEASGKTHVRISDEERASSFKDYQDNAQPSQVAPTEHSTDYESIEEETVDFSSQQKPKDK